MKKIHKTLYTKQKMLAYYKEWQESGLGKKAYCTQNINSPELELHKIIKNHCFSQFYGHLMLLGKGNWHHTFQAIMRPSIVIVLQIIFAFHP
jgi:hypothetical protein